MGLALNCHDGILYWHAKPKLLSTETYDLRYFAQREIIHLFIFDEPVTPLIFASESNIEAPLLMSVVGIENPK